MNHAACICQQNHENDSRRANRRLDDTAAIGGLMLETALVTVIAIVTLIIAIAPIAAWLVILIVRSMARRDR